MRFLKALLLSVLSLSCITTMGQSHSLSEELVEMFSPLEKNRISTGYLLDQSSDFVDIARYDGSSMVDSNYVDIGVFCGFFRCLNEAKIRNTQYLFDADEIMSILQNESSQTVKLGVALFEYNYIAENALLDNKISYVGGKVYDVYSNGIWKNPYNQRYACLLTVGKQIVNSSYVSFSFDLDDNFWSSIDPTYIDVDFGNGGGYVRVSPSFSGTINYLDYGTKELKLKIELEDESYLFSHTYITLTPPQIQTLSSEQLADRTDNYSITYSGETVSATVSYKYSPFHNHLTRPLIYVEGFDDPNIPSNGSFLSLISGGASSKGGQNYGTFIKDMFNVPDSLRLNYDYVYVDWGNPRADIKGCSQLLESIIDDVNNLKHQNGSNERNVIVGHSMGGLVVRYALASMERRSNRKLHETDYYVSYDVPHLGANVPVGAQYAVRDFVRCFYGNHYSATPFGFLVQWLVNCVSTALDCSSAKQMMFRRILSTGIEDNTAHLNWQSELNALGFPKGDKGYPIENISIVNGNIINSFGHSDLLFKAVIDADYALPDLLHFLLTLGTVSNMYVKAEVHESDGIGGTVSDLQINYTKRFVWLDNASPYYSFPILNSQHTDNYSTVLYDKIPSSIIKIKQDTSSLFSNIMSVDSTFAAFIPVASSLAINDYSEHRNFYTNPPTPLVDTPFDAFFIWDNRQLHALNFHWHWEWLENQMKMEIYGPSAIIQDGDVFSIINNSGHTEPIWSTSNSAVAEINSSGVIDVNSIGIVTLIYKDSKEYTINPNYTIRQYHYKHRKVLAGMPFFTLVKTCINGNNIVVSASCNNDDINSFLDDAASGGKISYYWGVKTGQNSIVWTATTSRSFTITPQSPTMVYFKIVDDMNREYSLLNTNVNPNNATFLTNYSPRIIYTFLGNIYFDYGAIQNYGINDDLFMIWSPPLMPFAQTPDRIIIDGQTIMRDSIITQTINGTSTTVYCFNILNSTYLQSIISGINSYPNHTALVSGMVCSGSDWLQDFIITVTKGLPPLN